MHMNDDEKLKVSVIHQSIVNYHNTLVQIRFAVASLFIAAVAFLVAGLIGEMKWHGPKVLFPVIGLVVTAVAWIFELRTTQLLGNLVDRGKKLEEDAKLVEGKGFFDLMTSPQPIGVRWPWRSYKELPKNENSTVRCLISHSFALNAVYFVFAIFWIIAFYIEATYVEHQADTIGYQPDTIWYIVLGWLFGLLTVSFTNWLQTKEERKRKENEIISGSLKFLFRTRQTMNNLKTDKMIIENSRKAFPEKTEEFEKQMLSRFDNEIQNNFFPELMFHSFQLKRLKDKTLWKDFEDIINKFNTFVDMAIGAIDDTNFLEADSAVMVSKKNYITKCLAKLEV